MAPSAECIGNQDMAVQEPDSFNIKINCLTFPTSSDKNRKNER